MLHASDPLDSTTEWNGETIYTVSERSVAIADGGATIDLPPVGFARLDATSEDEPADDEA